MGVDDLDGKVERLREAAERISANLVELEVDQTRELVDASALSGESAARWSAAKAELTELWRRQGLLEALVQEAVALRGPRRNDRLRSLLEEPSIELGRSDVPLAQRDLLGGSQIAKRCTPDELLRDMSSAFDQIKSAIADIAGAWEALIPKLDRARQLVQEADTINTDLGDHNQGDVDGARDELEAAGNSVTSDPLSVSPSDLDRLVRQLETITHELQASATLKQELEAKLVDAEKLRRQLLADVREGQAARDELVRKIVVSEPPGALEVGGDLEDGLRRISELAERGAWRDARRALDDWTSRTTGLRDDVQRALVTNRAPIEERNRARALLEAYQAKAKHLGLIEDPRLAEIFDRAQDVLYTAPTDLAVASELVRSYQQSLMQASPTPEAMP